VGGGALIFYAVGATMLLGGLVGLVWLVCSYPVVMLPVVAGLVALYVAVGQWGHSTAPRTFEDLVAETRMLKDKGLSRSPARWSFHRYRATCSCYGCEAVRTNAFLGLRWWQ
jgi:hypothetical protein